MQFRKQEAIVYLTTRIGESDGDYSGKEIEDVYAKSLYFREFADSFDKELLIECIKNGTLNNNSACYFLKDLDFKEKIELFAAFLLIIVADGETYTGEVELLYEYQQLIEFQDMDLAIERFKDFG